MSSVLNPKTAKNDKNIEVKPDRTVIRVGSRKSELALIQTNHVISLLKKIYPNHKFEIYEMTTVGDRILNISLPKIGEKSLFTKDLEEALKKGDVDFVVHSLKDLPTALPDDMTIGAVLKREDPRDALVLSKQHEGKCLKTLPAGSIIGTSSLRRIAQILRSNTHLKVHDIRGNLNTRLAKLDASDSKYAGIVLAQAGLVRLGWQKRINQTIEPSEMLYAVGQGALAVECRSSDQYILEMLESLVCHQTLCRILTERSFLKTLGGGCSAPVAVHSKLSPESTDSNKFKLHIIGAVWSLDGKIEKQAECECDLEIAKNSELQRDCLGTEDAVPMKRIKIESRDSKIDHENSDQMQHGTSQEINKIETDERVRSDFRENSFSSIGKEEKLSILGSSSSKCPLKFSVGQEVMGQCPFSADNNDMLLKTSKTDLANNLHIANKIGCPFKYEANHSVANCSTPKKIETQSETLDIIEREDLNSVGAVENLFCGIYPHSRWPLKVFEQCEQLGRMLANKLIEKGAISIMESAQNEIRSNI